MITLLAEYIITNYVKFEVTVYLDSDLCQSFIQLYDSADRMESINKNVITQYCFEIIANLCNKNANRFIMDYK